jgi:superfamily II DNA/RNA helicase
MNIKVHYPKPEELSPVFKIDSDIVEEHVTMPIPKPVTSFEQAFKDYPEILSECAKQGFSAPTPIQCQLWPCIMTGHDVVGIAQTGSGNPQLIEII